MRKNKNKSNAYMKASVEMLEQAENAIKSKYSQYDGTEGTMEHVLDEVEKGKDVLIRDAKRKGITEQDMRDVEYSKPNELEVERYKRHLKRRGLTDEQVRDKKNYEADKCNVDSLMKPLDFNPIINNRFICKLSFGDTVIEPYLVRSFHDDVFIKNIQVELFLDYEHIGLEEILEEVFTNGKGGRLKFSILEPCGVSLKDTNYSIKKIVSLVKPFYRFDDDGYINYHLVLEYDAKVGNKESSAFEKAFNVNPIDLIEINRKIESDDYENSDLSERIRKINTKYQETSENIKPKESSFDFGDFSTALEYFEHHLVGDKQYVHNHKFDEVDKDIENKHATVVVCSRSCGMTTHMLAHSLAKIATTPFHKIWYVTPYKRNINHIFSMNVSDEVRNLNDFEFNCYDGTIKCKSKRSEIRFVSSSQNVETIFIGRTLPNEVIYDDMAFMEAVGLNNFVDTLNEQEKVTGKYVKEVCVSTPSKAGSVFNFIALIARKPIYIPWYDNPLMNKDLELEDKNGRMVVKGSRKYLDWTFLKNKPYYHFTNKWFREMEGMMGKENAEVELCCRLGVDDEKPSEDDVEIKIHYMGKNDVLEKFQDDKDEPSAETEDKWYEIETRNTDSSESKGNRTRFCDYYPDDYDYEPCVDDEYGWCEIY